MEAWDGGYANRLMIQDLERPSRIYPGIQSDGNAEGGKYKSVTFQNVTCRRFKLSNERYEPHTIFEEINLDDADYEP